jgi:hypothetical protein
LEIAFQAILRANPDIKRDEFFDMAITMPELITAFTIVAQQTGIFTRDSPGEAMGVVSPPDWDSIIAHICHLTGWTWDYVEDTLTVSRLNALYNEWR